MVKLITRKEVAQMMSVDGREVSERMVKFNEQAWGLDKCRERRPLNRRVFYVKSLVIEQLEKL